MRNFSLQDKVCIFIAWVLMLTMHGVAEREYFHQSQSLTWDEARSHCQVCFKELVTMTPFDTEGILHDLTSDHWIGLRKNLNPSSNPTNVSWSRWANGDPLAFQNWYPGWPALKSSFPKSDCCSCSCTCPSVVTPTMTGIPTGFTEDATSTSGLTEDATSGFTPNLRSANSSSGHTSTAAADTAECVRSPMVPSHVQEPDFMEDSCVAMLRFGAWVERNCSDSLPFICYEDRFVGRATVDNVTTESAQVKWQPAPGPISHYSFEVEGDEPSTERIYDGLSHDLANLMAGTLYSVQVFPVKCERRLNPENVTFYTVPNKVTNLNVTTQTETCISLSWDRPAGGVHFYRIQYDASEEESVEEGKDVCNLTPGTPYTFIVLAGVGRNESTWSEASNITEYTRPGKVSDLRASDNSVDSLLLTWTPPVGNATAFWVQATDDRNHLLFNQTVQRNQTLTRQEKRVTGLPIGAKVILSVAALASDTRGDKVTLENHTVPGPISDLHLTTEENSLNASWTLPDSNFTSFTVELWLGEDKARTANVTTYAVSFDSLKTAANYTVRVYSVSGSLLSPPKGESGYTLPAKPTDAKVTHANKTHITLQWEPPANIVSVSYSVNISSNFWGYNQIVELDNKTSHTFDNLTSGTKYDFEVRTVVGQLRSAAEDASHCTEAEKREISLSMLCSSQTPLLCAKSTTEDTVFEELQSFFEKYFGDQIFWRLEKQRK